MKLFRERSSLKELIDEPGIAFADWERCLHELNTVNTWLGGHAITIDGVKQLLPPGSADISIAEIGCGGGDNLNAINKWLRKRNVKYTGIDLNAACVDFAQKNCRALKNKIFIHSDYSRVDFENNKPDIIFSSLFCHHFSNEQIIDMLVWLKKNSRSGFFINDLQRHPVAFYSIRWITRLFSRSYLIKNDAPISVMRGFRRNEWKRLLQQAGINNYSIHWKWAFRYLVIVHNEE